MGATRFVGGNSIHGSCRGPRGPAVEGVELSDELGYVYI